MDNLRETPLVNLGHALCGGYRHAARQVQRFRMPVSKINVLEDDPDEAAALDPRLLANMSVLLSFGRTVLSFSAGDLCQRQLLSPHQAKAAIRACAKAGSVALVRRQAGSSPSLWRVIEGAI